MTAERPICGVVATCGRPADHRGMHGGFVLARTPRAIGELPPTPRQIEAMAEYVRHGTMKEAAACIGITEPTIKHLLIELRARIGAETSIEAVVALGWAKAPATTRHAA